MRWSVKVNSGAGEDRGMWQFAQPGVRGQGVFAALAWQFRQAAS
jgi:hypothetical protein